MRRHVAQLGDVTDDVAFGFAVGHGFEGESHIPPVIGVGRRPCGNRPDQVARLDRVDGRAANAGLAVLRQAAGAHAAQLAAHAGSANVAWRHLVRTGESRADADFIGTDEHLLGGGVDAVFFGASFLLSHDYSPSSIDRIAPTPGHGQSGRPANATCWAKPTVMPVGASTAV